MRVTLEYSAKDYVPGQYFLIAQFVTNQTYTTDGKFPNDRYPVPCGSRGVVTLTFPVKYVWDTPNVRKPLQVLFVLTKGTLSSSRIVATTVPMTFPVR